MEDTNNPYAPPEPTAPRPSTPTTPPESEAEKRPEMPPMPPSPEPQSAPEPPTEAIPPVVPQPQAAPDAPAESAPTPPAPAEPRPAPKPEKKLSKLRRSRRKKQPDPEPAPTADPLLGTIIDNRYVIHERIARGGMATVYRAEDRRLDRPVALKIMHPHLAESADFIARFRREARSAARLTHQGVVGVYDQGITADTGYLVMELVEGPNLRQYLREMGCLTVREALDITLQILEALAAAHRANLVHRDVKPENVLITVDGSCKVADFGLARAVSEVTAATTGSVLGTVAYLAPEIVTDGSADARADVYAVGVMLYELLAGAPPYQNQPPIQIAYSHVHEGIPRIREQADWVPPEIDDLIAKLAERDPDKRPADAGEAADLVREVMEKLSPEALALRGDTPPTPPAPAQPAQTATDPGSTVALQLGAPLMETIAISQPGEKKKKKKPKAPKPQVAPEVKQSRKRWMIASGVLAVIAAVVAWFFLLGPGAYREMIDVSKQTWASASAKLQEQGFDFVRQDEFSDTVAKDLVIKTIPAAKDDVFRFSSVTVVVSKGVEYITVPSLEGKTREQAADTLKKARLTNVNITEEYSETVPEKQVVSQDPAAGTSLPHNERVNVVISKGRQPIEVPDLRGKSLAEASEQLNALGLRAGATEQFSDEIDRGTIISQEVAPGEKRFRDDVINVVVSKGPEKFPLPDVRGKTVSEATGILQSYGFQVERRSTYSYFGLVADTDPSPGTIVKYGSTIIIKTV